MAIPTSKKFWLITYDGKPLNVYRTKRGAVAAMKTLRNTGNCAPAHIEHLPLEKIQERMLAGQDNLATHGHCGL